jgi:hypothetical protein
MPLWLSAIVCKTNWYLASPIFFLLILRKVTIIATSIQRGIGLAQLLRK